MKLSDEELKKLGDSGKQRKDAEEDKEIKDILSKNHVL
jgi:hypothetical protein